MGNSWSGLVSWLYDEKDMRILVVGLDAAGKTTILHKLEIGEIITTIPTVDFPNTQGIIFVVDSNDRERVSQAREELQHMMNEDELQEAPFLIFANKHDLPNAMNEDEIADKLGLYDVSQRTWLIQVASATNGDGLAKGIDWLVNIMN